MLSRPPSYERIRPKRLESHDHDESHRGRQGSSRHGIDRDEFDREQQEEKRRQEKIEAEQDSCDAELARRTKRATTAADLNIVLEMRDKRVGELRTEQAEKEAQTSENQPESSKYEHHRYTKHKAGNYHAPGADDSLSPRRSASKGNRARKNSHLGGEKMHDLDSSDRDFYPADDEYDSRDDRYRDD